MKTLYELKHSLWHWYGNIASNRKYITLESYNTDPLVYMGTLTLVEVPIYIVLYVKNFVYFIK